MRSVFEYREPRKQLKFLALPANQVFDVKNSHVFNKRSMKKAAN